MRLSRAMRPALFVVLIFCFAWLAATCTWAAAKQSILLNQGWQFRQVTNLQGIAHDHWLPATVPGDVQLDLLRNKLIPEPFYRDNEKKLQWIENADWEYRTTIPASEKLLNRTNIELVFDGLDTCAQVYLNGNLLLTSDNMFRTYRLNAKPYLKLGDNQLRIVFTSPIQGAEKIADQDPWRPRTHTQARWYIRKAAYQYGWDWSPRLVTSGVWRPARLEFWDDARISDLNIRQFDVTKQSAHVLAQVDVTASVDSPATVTVRYGLNGKEWTAAQTTELHPGINHVDLPITIAHPELWYPAGYGSQPLYAFHAAVAIRGDTQDTSDVRTGLRSVELRRDPDQWGRSFEFVVNGIPIFAKGANVVPFDSFPSRVPVAQIRDILQSAKDANMNMIRIWGGGYYETQQFYELCDEMGIMVWQDFMFGNPWQPGTFSFKQNVAQEVEDQLKRLRNHPSIVLWCGNNEQENNFLQDSLHITQIARLQMWQDYLTVFSGIIPTLVARYDSGAAYWPSSPSGDYAETRAMNYRVLEDGDDVGGNEEFGDTHDYSVWTSIDLMPRVPFTSEEDRHYRFVSEYGFQSMPEMRTIDAFTLPQDRTSTSTEVMTAHQKDPAGYATMLDYIRQYYGQPKDFSSLVYASQVIQAEFIKLVAEHLRRDRPRTMGSIFWQLNDCWPVVSPSSIDYYGRWKALQYYARRFYSPLLVSPRLKDGTLNVSVVSDETTPTSASLRVRVMKFDGTVLHTQTQYITIPALSSQVYLQLPTQTYPDPADTVAAMDLTVNGKQVSSNLMYLAPTADIHLPPAEITSHLTPANGAYEVRLSSKVLARDVYVSFGDHDAKFSDNYFDLLPGEPQTIVVHSPASLAQLQNSMKVMSLVDAIQPNTVWKNAAEN
ncbi:MAG: glycoside hydrolase family 2 protein [Acidobacteriaceae bacterium]